MISDISSFLAVWQWGCITWSSMWSLESDIQLWNCQLLCSRKFTLINIYTTAQKPPLIFNSNWLSFLPRWYNDAKRCCRNRFLRACSERDHCGASEPPLDQWHSISSLNSNLICSLWQIRAGISKEESNSRRKVKRKVLKSHFWCLQSPCISLDLIAFVGSVL